MTDEERELVRAILAHQEEPEEDHRAELAALRIRARIAELKPLVAFGGALGAVYAAEVLGLEYGLRLLEEPEDVQAGTDPNVGRLRAAEVALDAVLSLTPGLEPAEVSALEAAEAVCVFVGNRLERLPT